MGRAVPLPGGRRDLPPTMEFVLNFDIDALPSIIKTGEGVLRMRAAATTSGYVSSRDPIRKSTEK